MHDNAHGGRCEGGIQAGSTVGVLLDLDRHQLSFYVNEELQVKLIKLEWLSEILLSQIVKGPREIST